MATANDGISRFSNSSVLGTPTFVNGASFDSIVALPGQVGYSYQPALIPAPGAAFVTTVAQALFSQALPKGTYIVSVIANTNHTSAIIQDTFLNILNTAGVSVGSSQFGESNAVVSDVGIGSVPLTTIVVLTAPTTLTVFLSFAFSPPSSVVLGTAISQFCTMTRIA
jgi:hypothetical protein